MQNINIGSNEIQLTVNGDENRMIRFNPNDLNFVDKFLRLTEDLGAKQAEYVKKAEELDAAKNGGTNTMKAGLELLKEICGYFREKIDEVFGPGTSQAAFGDTMSLDMFEDFFAGIAPMIQKARSAKTAKYTGGFNRSQRRAQK